MVKKYFEAEDHKTIRSCGCEYGQMELISGQQTDGVLVNDLTSILSFY